MKPAPCPRLFEAEAARDGRLTGAELASFERHMGGCPTCRSEADALEGLANRLRAAAGDAGVEDRLHVRRERTRLLAAFDRALLAPEQRSTAPRRRLWSTALMALLASGLVFWRIRQDAPRSRVSAIIHADSTAVWSERIEGDRETIVLERGGLWVHVDHSSGKGRLLVVLPDGELEDTGTTFTVSAEDGRTTGVAVQEGHVVLRIRGEPTASLAPGQAWTPKPRPTASASPSALSADTDSAAHADAGEQTSPPSSLSAPAASPVASDASLDFRTAMAAFDVGDNHRAAIAFANFLDKHPRDPHAEDAAYLHVIALQRSGDKAGMKQSALEYLRRFPAGFRQADVEPLAR